MYNRCVKDQRCKENMRLVKDLILCVGNRFKEDLRYRKNRRLVNKIIPGVCKTVKKT